MALTIREALMGPAPCQGCGAWVEWNGLAWVGLDTDQFHDCAPYLPDAIAAARQRLDTALAASLPTYGATDLGARPVVRPADYTEPAWLLVTDAIMRGLAIAAAVIVACGFIAALLGWRP